MLQQYKADKNLQKIVNLLRAVQQIQAAQGTSVTIETIQRCQQKSTLFKKLTLKELAQIAELKLKGDTIVVDDRTADRIELQGQIAQLLIENLLSLNEFLNLEDKTIFDKDKDVFTSVVNYYATAKLGEEEESSSGKEEEEIKEVQTAEALRAVEIVKMWMLQKGDSQDLQALDRLVREIAQYKISTAYQTTIHRFFKQK